MDKFVQISDEKRKELEQRLYDKIVKTYRVEEISPHFYSYEVLLQNILFRTAMTDDELMAAVVCTIDLLEEFRSINNSGINREKFTEIQKAVEKSEECESEIIHDIEVMQSIETEKIQEIKAKLARICRVGGAYFMLISNMGLNRVILDVYNVLVDRFDDLEIYEMSAYFMLRGIMHMHSDEIEVDD